MTYIKTNNCGLIKLQNAPRFRSFQFPGHCYDRALTTHHHCAADFLG